MNNLKALVLALIATFAALIIVLGGVLPVGTLDANRPPKYGIDMAGMILGWRRGGLATVLFLAVGLVGIPQYGGVAPTLAVIRPTIGYVVGYLFTGLSSVPSHSKLHALRRHELRCLSWLDLLVWRFSTCLAPWDWCGARI